MNAEYTSKCPECQEELFCAEGDLMGWPEFMIQSGNHDPLAITCDECGAKLHMTWTVALELLHSEDEDEIMAAQDAANKKV